MRAALIILTLAYVLSQFYRAFLAVLAAPLAADIGATAAQLSTASGVWFLAFAAMQIPVGWALDTLGPRRTNAVLFGLFATAGALLFALAQTPWHINIAMALIGVGCSAVLMAAYYIVARTYSAAVFATLAAAIIGTGSLGNIGAAYPMTLLVDAVGWRMAMVLLGVITLAVAVACAIIVRDPPKITNTTQGSFWDILRMPAIWLFIPMALVNYAPAAGLRGLWIGPYFNDVFQATPEQIGSVTTLMALAMIAGNFAYGPMDRLLGSRKWVILGGNTLSIMACVGLYLFGATGFWTAATLLACIGFFGSSFPVVVAHGRAFFPPHLVGRGVTLINLCSIGGVGILQPLSGRVFAANQTGGYDAVFVLFAGVLLLGMLIYLFCQDRTD